MEGGVARWDTWAASVWLESLGREIVLWLTLSNVSHYWTGPVIREAHKYDHLYNPFASS